MQAQELLETYDKAAVVIKQFYLQHMLESLNDENLPENFKDFVKEQGIDNDTVAVMITASPRTFFDVFDTYKIYIQITVDIENNCFRYSFDGGKVESNDYTTRKEAELEAVKMAFQTLNEKL
jgi:adenosylcobinamide amidohydrolase